jgi:HAD superfamily hydrolase (TIGR01549 family)
LIEAVIFDLDGTLIQLSIDYEKLFQEFRKIMKVSNLHPLVETVSKLDDKTRKEVFKVWDKAELAALAKMTVNDEGIKIYKKFPQKPKALITVQGKALVKAALERLELSFNVIFTREDSVNRVEQLKNAAQKLGTRIQNVLFVGNTENDFLAAKKVNCQFLRVK